LVNQDIWMNSIVDLEHNNINTHILDITNTNKNIFYSITGIT